MVKPSGKKKKNGGDKPHEGKAKSTTTPKTFDEDTAMFISMAQELKDEGNKLFQKRDHEAAMLKYEKAIKLLPITHIDVAYLRSNMAACHMQMGLSEYPMAINQCNMALQVNPKYSKALLKRAKCYEALNRLDLAYRDVDLVLYMEPNNLSALEISRRVKSALEKKGIKVDENGFNLVSECTEIPCVMPSSKSMKERSNKKKSRKVEEEKKAEDMLVVEEKDMLVVEENSGKVEENIDERNEEYFGKVEEGVDEQKEDEETKPVKLVLGEDIRCAPVPVRCNIQRLKDTVHNRFPMLKSFSMKYKDQEGDLITVTSTEELRWAEKSFESQGSLKLYIAEAEGTKNGDKVPEGAKNGDKVPEGTKNGERVPKIKIGKNVIPENGNAANGKEHGSFYVDDWIVQFARVFKNHVGFNSDAYLDLNDLGMKLYSDAMEDTVTCEEAQELFDNASETFQEMAALAMFNWGNVHMSKARKKVYFTEDGSEEAILAQVKAAYEWAQKEFVNAGKRYEKALNIKSDFYEAFLALGQQQFEQARLSWYYAIATRVDLETFPTTEILQLYNNAEKNMEEGMQIWEDMEEKRLNRLSTPDKLTTDLQKMGLDGLSKDITAGEAAEQAANMRGQVSLLWGTILYERSVVEYKLGLPSWEECLEFAVEKFELAGASPTDVAVMIKNHCANQTATDGLGFKIDEIVQAWNEMYDARRWKRGVPSFRLEPLFRRRVPNLHHVLEHV